MCLRGNCTLIVPAWEQNVGGHTNRRISHNGQYNAGRRDQFVGSCDRRRKDQRQNMELEGTKALLPLLRTTLFFTINLEIFFPP